MIWLAILGYPLACILLVWPLCMAAGRADRAIENMAIERELWELAHPRNVIPFPRKVRGR